MTKTELDNIWNYYLTLEADLENTSRYVEPTQKDVYSFEFLKIIMLVCSEIETVFKYLCNILSDGKKFDANILGYKSIILSRFPKIETAQVYIARANEHVIPFENWSSEKLQWWDAYQDIKHNRGTAFAEATYWNAAQALAGLYILIFYLSGLTDIEFDDTKASYVYSKYSSQLIAGRAPEKLPDFE